MKKFMSVLLAAALCFGMYLPASAAQTGSVDDLLAPYQAAIKQVNDEVGSSYFIPAGNKQQVYNGIKDKTPAEFALTLKDEYKNYLVTSFQSQTGDNIYGTTNASADRKGHLESVIATNWYQTYPIQYNSYMYLNSYVLNQPSGVTYANIFDYGSNYDPSNQSFHFGLSSGSYFLSGNEKQCTITLKGFPVDPHGVALGITLHVSHTFTTY